MKKLWYESKNTIKIVVIKKLQSTEVVKAFPKKFIHLCTRSTPYINYKHYTNVYIFSVLYCLYMSSETFWIHLQKQNLYIRLFCMRKNKLKHRSKIDHMWVLFTFDVHLVFRKPLKLYNKMFSVFNNYSVIFFFN